MAIFSSKPLCGYEIANRNRIYSGGLMSIAFMLICVWGNSMIMVWCLGFNEEAIIKGLIPLLIVISSIWVAITGIYLLGAFLYRGYIMGFIATAMIAQVFFPEMWMKLFGL